MKTKKDNKKTTSPKPNIILIVIDALRAKNLSCYGYDKQTSPNIDYLAKKGAVFKNAFSCINATEPSLTSIMTGKLPINHGIINHGENISKKEIKKLINSRISFLPEVLRNKGYNTYALDWLGRWHKKGFDYYMGDSEKSSKAKKLIGNIHKKIKEIGKTMEKHPTIYKFLRKVYQEKIFEDANELTKKAINILTKKGKKPVFLFIHYWDTHSPYRTPRRIWKRFYSRDRNLKITPEALLKKIGNINIRCSVESMFSKKKDIHEILAKYDACINTVDTCIKRIIDLIEKDKNLKNTIIIITSDHGESLLEHEIFFDHHGLYDVSIHVPLIIHDFRKDLKTKNSALVQHTDLFPTILDLLKFDIKTDFDGASLVPLINMRKKRIRKYIFVEEAHTQRKRAIRTKQYKYIQAVDKKRIVCRYCKRIHGEEEELYDLKKDPEEKENIVTKKKKLATKFRKTIKTIIEKNSLKETINDLKI